MSLTSHLKNSKSPVRKFVLEQFHTRSLTTQINNTIPKETILPSHIESSNVLGWIGTAFDYMIRFGFLFQEINYTALVAWSGAENMKRYYNWKVIIEFFDQLYEELKYLEKQKNNLSLDNIEQLARYCFVLALFESQYRSGSDFDRTSPLWKPVVFQEPESQNDVAWLFSPQTVSRESVEELLALADHTWIMELCQLFHSCTLPDLHPRQVISNPHFIGGLFLGGADGDILLDTCLIDIKTSKNKATADWLYQLAGYVLLDWHDAYKIDSVGIYLARQAKLITWALPEFLGAMNARVELKQLREEFRTLCIHLR